MGLRHHLQMVACWALTSGMLRGAGSECGSSRGLALASEMKIASRIEQIAAEHPNATLLSLEPPIVAFDGLLSPGVAQRIVRLTESSLSYSETQAGIDRSVTSHKSAEDMIRNSKTAWCGVRGAVRSDVLVQPSHQHHKFSGCGSDRHVIELTARIANLTGQARETFEDLQVLRYRAGEHYHAHHDYLPGATQTSMSALGSKGGENPRVMTFFLYLNDVAEDAGGETEFPDAVALPSTQLPSNVRWVDGRLRVRPKLGSALLWSNVKDNDVLCAHPLAKHAALDVEPTAARSVMKRAANLWIHIERTHTGYSQAEIDAALAVSEKLKAEGSGSDKEQQAPKKAERKKRVRKKATGYEEEL